MMCAGGVCRDVCAEMCVSRCVCWWCVPVCAGGVCRCVLVVCAGVCGVCKHTNSKHTHTHPFNVSKIGANMLKGCV